MSSEKGKKILGTVIKNSKNLEMFFKNISEKVPESDIDSCCYQVAGLLMHDNEMKQVLGEVKEGKIGWNSSCFKEVAETIEEYDQYLKNPFEVAEGVSECKKCGSKKTWSIQKQTRSSDEPMTTFTRCVKCGHQWTYSG